MRLNKKSFSNYIGDRAFYTMVLSITVPILIQNLITNFVNLLDNIMVGRLGTEQMSAVAIINQLLFVYNLSIFGGLSGPGIYTAQFFGSKNDEGIRSTLRFKLIMATGLTAAAALIYTVGGEALIGSYLKGKADGADPELVMHYAKIYLNIMLAGLPGFMLTQVYAGTLKECGETVSPMRASLAAVFVNLVFNYILIYGHFGFPRLGVAGAAIATVLSRYVELAIVLIWIRCNEHKVTYLSGVYRTLRVPLEHVKNYLLKGLPLLVNEFLWSSGMAVLNQIYSSRGLSVVAGMNISITICSLFNVAFLTLGSSVGIIVGQQLGTGDLKKAKQTDTRLIALSCVMGLSMGLIAALTSRFFPMIYNVSDEARKVAAEFIAVNGLFMVQGAFLQSCYFTIRTGGKTMITFLFDSGYTWCVNIPVAWIAAYFTPISAVMICVCVNCSDFIKTVIGFRLVRSNKWLNNMVGTSD